MKYRCGDFNEENRSPLPGHSGKHRNTTLLLNFFQDAFFYPVSEKNNQQTALQRGQLKRKLRVYFLPTQSPLVVEILSEIFGHSGVGGKKRVEQFDKLVLSTL